MKDYKIKIIALAKNEAYFLPQWVYHHFYFGFDAIDIYVNRTFDNTLAVIEKLKNKFPDLNYFDANWVDSIWMAPGNWLGLQNVIYSYAYYNTLKDFEYVIFLDIDEFWTPVNNNKNIKQVLNDFNYPSMITFEWFCLDGNNEHNMPVFSARKLKGKGHILAKSIVKTSLKLEKLKVHIQCINNKNDCYLADKTKLKRNKNFHEGLDPACITGMSDYIIVHDWLRTPVFHLANILNGHVSGINKDNFLSLKRTKAKYNDQNLIYNDILNINFNDAYLPGFNSMLEELNLTSDMNQGLLFQYLRALDCVRVLSIYGNSELIHEIEQAHGQMDNLHENIFNKIVSLDNKFKKFKCDPATSPSKLISTNINNTIDNFLNAINLFPYSSDQYGHPVFLKELVRYLLNFGLFEKAMDFVNSEDLESNHVFKSNWYAILFGRAYEKFGKTSKALEIYEKLIYAGNNEAMEALTRINNIKNNKS